MDTCHKQKVLYFQILVVDSHEPFGNVRGVEINLYEGSENFKIFGRVNMSMLRGNYIILKIDIAVGI